MEKKFKVKALRNRDLSNSDLISDLKRVAKLLKLNSVTREQYDKNGKFSSQTIKRRFGGWLNALNEANLKPTRKPLQTTEDYFENLENVWRILGRQPSIKEMKAPLSKLTGSAYEQKFCSWGQALKEFESFVSGKTFISRNSDKKQSSRTERKVSWRLRAQILIRDNCICQMCGACPAKNSEVELHVDHILPYSKGGETIPENLQTLCKQCNLGKGNSFS